MNGLHRYRMPGKSEREGEKQAEFVRDSKGRCCQPHCLGLLKVPPQEDGWRGTTLHH